MNQLKSLQSEIKAEITRNHEPSSSEEDAVLKVTKEYVEGVYKQKGIEVSWPWIDYSYTQNWEHFTLNTRVDYKINKKSYSDKIYSEVDRSAGQYILTYITIGDKVELDKRGSVNTSLVETANNQTSEVIVSNGETAQVSINPPPVVTELVTGSIEHNAICTANDVNIRKTPNKGAGSIGQLKKNEIVYVYDVGEGDKETAWAHISTAKGEGYILIKYLELTDIASATVSSQSNSKTNTAATTVEDPEKAFKSQCKKLDYHGIERNPDKYKGEFAKVTGKVIQVSEGWFDSVTCRVRESGDNIWYVNYTHKEGEPRILEDDTVTFYGKCDGVTTYTTILGASVTIPELDAQYVDIK